MRWMRRSRAPSVGRAGASTDPSEARELGRSAAFFGAAVGLFSMTCCGLVAVVFGSAAAAAVSAALAGPLGPVAGALLLALDALFVGSIVVRRRRRAACGPAGGRSAPSDALPAGGRGGAATRSDDLAEADHHAA